MPMPSLLLDLVTAMAIGLLIGIERGWSSRGVADGRLAAGIRTYGLIGLLGGLAALLSQPFGVGAWIAILLAFSALVAISYLGDLRNGDMGMTSEVALLLTFLLGSLALSDQRMLAAGCAVIVALLLSLKDQLHTALQKLSALELSGALKLLFISLVLLPALPNQGFGPWEVFNPYSIWWMVVLIAGIGFAAYVAVRLVGTRHGLLLTALLGSLVSSTAMTLSLSRMRERVSLHNLLACGLLATSALMFPRVLLEVGVVNPALLPALLAPLLVACAFYLMGALWWYFRPHDTATADGDAPLSNPFELAPALRFALLLALILFLVEAGRRLMGDMGVYLVALVSGLADVDAITLSLARNALGGLEQQIAVRGIFIAALSNSLVKAGLIVAIGGKALAIRTLPFIIGGLAAGGAVLLAL
ncbi:MAG TPA: MgtC/SapB family protein [Pseudomonas sp.]|nr:MgtC/SapB family protein [Pseudomonas sp.]